MQKLQDQDLQIFRKKIDAIDEKLIGLLEDRMKIINEVAILKKEKKEKFFIRPNREADMIKNLINKPNLTFSKSVIIDIWRKIITTANMSEQKISIALHNPKNIVDYSYLIKKYYSDEIVIAEFKNAEDVILEIKKNVTKIGVFACNSPENWWINLAKNDDLKIFTRIPFTKSNDDKIELFAVASINPQASIEDNSLFCIELESKITSEELVKKLENFGLQVKILQSVNLTVKTLYLTEIDGFIEENDEKLMLFKKNIANSTIRLLGNYAK